MLQVTKITVLNEAERAYFLYKKSKSVADLLVWFKAELALEPIGCENHLTYTDDFLLKHTRHVENLAHQWRGNRK